MLKSPLSFTGRIRRTEYGLSCVGYPLIYYFAWGMDEGRGGDFLALFLVAPTLWFLLAQGAKRCHDIGKNGWWQLIPFYIFWMLLKNGDAGTNAYGNNPRAVPFVDNEDNLDYRNPSNSGL